MPELTKISRIICILLLLPLLYVNVKVFHDWGDDFAQYVIQAKNMVEGRPQVENGLVFDKVDGDFALHAYPAGFPLLIAPIFYFFGLAITPYLVFISLFMIGLGWLMFEYFKKDFHPVISLLLVLLILYNRYFLWLKDSILSDIPFIFFLFVLILFAGRKTTSSLFYITCGILAAWIASIRFVGIVALPALVLHVLLHDEENKSQISFRLSAQKIKAAALITVSAFSFFLLFNTFIFHIGLNDFLGFYSNSFGKESAGFITNVKYYYDIIGTIFLYPDSEKTLPGLWIYISLIGWVWNLYKKSGFTEWFFLFYLLMILLFNRSTGGFRFFAPVFPLMIKYTSDIFVLIWTSMIKSRFVVGVAFILFLLSGYISPLKFIIEDQVVSHDGPYTPGSAEMLKAVNEKIPKNEVIGFYKALVISLYTHHPSTYLMTGQPPVRVEEMFRRLHVNYLIVSKSSGYSTDIYDPRMNDYLAKFRNRYSVFWENAEYIILYRMPIL